MVEHGAVLNLVQAQSEYFNISRDERILQFSNYCFDASVEQIFIALCNGASLVLFPKDLLLDMAAFERLLKQQKVSHLHATPFFLENLTGDHFRDLKRLISGGDICKKELSNRWKNKLLFYNEYGPTETTVTSVESHVNGNDPEEIISYQ
jgi:non-ribosomal peptide synthetase component F